MVGDMSAGVPGRTAVVALLVIGTPEGQETDGSVTEPPLTGGGPLEMARFRCPRIEPRPRLCRAPKQAPAVYTFVMKNKRVTSKVRNEPSFWSKSKEC